MRVLCTIPTASTNISGIAFARHATGHMVSEEISDEQAARFLNVEGFRELEQTVPGDVEPASQEPADEAKTDDDDAEDDDETEDLDADDDEDVEPDDASKEPTTARVPVRKSGAKKKKR